MRRACLVGCTMLSILLISPVTTWASSCPEGEKWNDRRGECVKDRTSSSKKNLYRSQIALMSPHDEGKKIRARHVFKILYTLLVTRC